MKYLIYILFVLIIISCTNNDDDIKINNTNSSVKLNTLPITEESLSSLILNGELKLFESNYDEIGFVIDTIPDVSLTKKMLATKSVLQTDNKFRSKITSLTSNKTLYYNTYAKIGNKIYYGNEIAHKQINDNALIIKSDLILDTQEKVNELATHNYTSIRQKGSSSGIYITGNVYDLKGLTSLKYLNVKTINIYNTEITNLEGLNNITGINTDIRNLTQSIIIYNNHKLKTINNFFNNLEDLEFGIHIYQNKLLETINGFGKPEYLYGYVNISDNQNLQTINMLTEAKKAYNLYITNNSNLTNIKGFEKFDELSSIEINNNPKLSSDIKFDNLTNCGGIKINENKNIKKISFNNINKLTLFSLENNSNLESININNLTEVDYLYLINNKITDLLNFSQLKRINNYLFVNNNQLIKNLDGLNNVSKFEKVIITYNKNLKDFCAIKHIKKTNYKSLEINNNLYNPSIDDIEEKCKLQ
ncbi:hypothetical protein [Empedobacter brevis]|uniref:hypothetical protein n=1 Tax=Empedobacter brevis TaxID=247 RepID=UPI00289DC322|nr:hypothetical protein [Empedobacter brevis]